MPKSSRGGRRNGATTSPTPPNPNPQPNNPTQGGGAGGGVTPPQRGSKQSGHDLIANWTPGFDDNGNPALVKWQGQEDTKSARYLSKIDKDYTFVPDKPGSDTGVYKDANGNVISDTHPFYAGEYQKFALATNLNGKPQIMDDKAFDAMVKANNLQVLYRGESGQAAADRFMTDDYNHTGVGSYGDGHYFSTSKNDAIGYAQMKSKWQGTGKVETMVLSPTARAIKHSDLVRMMRQADPKLLKACGIAGRSSTGGYHNDGEAQFALKMGYNVIAVDSWGKTYCYACDRTAFIVKRSLETY